MTWMTSIFAFRDFSENGREFTPRTFVRLDNSERNEISVERKTLMWTLKGRDSPEAETKERLAECFSILFFVVRVRVYSRTTKYTITIDPRARSNCRRTRDISARWISKWLPRLTCIILLECRKGNREVRRERENLKCAGKYLRMKRKGKRIVNI